MIRILWTFRVPADRELEFVRVYGPEGDWVRFFTGARGYVGTRLLRDLSGPHRYLTEDTWDTALDYDRFSAEQRLRYDELDVECQALTVDERLIGIFESVDD
jgi:hypothetical protein